ncbi:hypothetical protein K1T73_06795 [Roseovarius sp. SCSIO 43702]|uniref:hypothetical protein n=1 Tax=Roseovarius sp. SCSIO 43702 TaxID=2823043 RepID=UPI001C733D69|nr:hypothetical protein [Roseovarius sp. SCSIO 43702]QYX58073.1 hypothetical protein K1T73_06795 [Roseovarius sp. SCSIO 43702]
MKMVLRAKRHRTAAVALMAGFGSLIAAPLLAQQGPQGWRALCVPGNEVEILVGSSWYRSTVVGPNEAGEEECGVLNTSYTGRELRFAMAPERIRAIQAPGVASPPVGPAPPAGAPLQKTWRALCVPGGEVEILVGSAWYKGVVIGPDEFGEAYCGVLNTSYSGRDMHFTMAPERMRAPRHSAPVDAVPSTPQPGDTSAPAITAGLAEIGEAYRNNTPSARAQFENKTVILDATLRSVGSDYIRLTDGPHGDAACTFDEGQRAELATLEPGARLTVRGEDSSWGWGTFQLKSCRVLAVNAASPAPTSNLAQASGQPPFGRYVCRQYMTTIGYIDLGSGSYAVNGVNGTYDLEQGSGYITWNGGAYAGWPAKYEFSPAGAGHANDEHIIRMTDESGRLTIDCFLMAE